MKKDLKILIGIIALSLAMVAGMVILSRGSSDVESNQKLSEIQAVEVNPGFFDMGIVDIDGGIVSRSYSLKNTSSDDLKIKKIATSCMCTKAKIIYQDKETKLFGMEAHGDLNPILDIAVAPGEEIKVIAEFDPAAHGPAGVGAFNRSVWVTFSEPLGVKELKFQGSVVKN